MAGCNCDQVIRSETIAKELVNLAIASTVACLRNELSEWTRTKKASSPSLAIASKERSDEMPSWYESWSQVPYWAPIVKTSQDSSQALHAQHNLNMQYSDFRSKVQALNRGTMMKMDFKEGLSQYVENTALIAKDYPNVKWTFSPPPRQQTSNEDPPAGPKPIEFRPPTIEEIRDDSKWDAYLVERGKFDATVELLDIAARMAAIKSQGKGENLTLPADFFDLEVRVDSIINSVVTAGDPGLGLEVPK